MSAMLGAGLLVVGAWIGAVLPGVQTLWMRFRDGLLTMSAGLLVGTALLHLLPHAMPLGANVGYAVLGGFLGVLLLEAVFHSTVEEPGHTHDHHHAHGVTTSHAHSHDEEGSHLAHEGVDAHEQHLAISALVGFSLHGIVDGVVIFASGSAGSAWTTAIALLAHHIPLAASCASLLRVGGHRRSFWPVIAVSSVMPVLGVLLADSTLGKGSLPLYLCGVASGVFLYVATHNLLPVMDVRKGGRTRLLVLLLGAGIAAVTEMIGG